MDNLKATWKFTQFLFWCVLLIPPQFIILLFSDGPAAYKLPQFFHRRVCNIFGIKILTEGTPVDTRPALYVSNHVSYLDISVISCAVPVSFVAKAEVATWPLFGMLAKLQRTAFINRARHSVMEGRQDIASRLTDGAGLVVFPEGTSSDGASALPFKSSLFSALTDAEFASPPVIQPFTIELLETDGNQIRTQKDRDRYAWHGDMTLMPHFWAFAKSSGAKVKLHFHDPIRVKDDVNRKELALTCHKMVARPLEHKTEAAA